MSSESDFDYDINQYDISNFDVSKFDVDKFNNLLGQVSDYVLCDANCQEERKLKAQALNDETQEMELKSTVEEISDTITSEFDNKVAQIKTQIDTYNGLFINLENVYDLYSKYEKRNKQLLLDLKDETNDVLTNERKTYYEDQGIDSLKFYYYYFLLTIYIVCVIMFGFFSLRYPSQFSIMARIGIFILLSILPFISSFILGNFIYLLHEVYNLLPKNVYKTI